MRGGIDRGEEGESGEAREAVDVCVWAVNEEMREGERDGLSWRTKECTFEWRKNRAKTSRRAAEVCMKMKASPVALKVISFAYSACERRCESCEIDPKRQLRPPRSSLDPNPPSLDRNEISKEPARKRTLEMNGVTASWCESSALAGLPTLPVSTGLASPLFLPAK